MGDLAVGLNLVLVGMFVVFSALILLSLIISLFPMLFVRKNAEPGKPKQEYEPAVLETRYEEETEMSDKDMSDDSLIAVLTAAVMASMKSSPDIKIRVTSFKRIPQSSPVWNATGRREYIADKL